MDGLEVFLELYGAIVATLETINANAERSWNADSNKKAVSKAVLAFVKELTVKMQGTLRFS